MGGFAINPVTVPAMRKRLVLYLVEEEGASLRTNIKDPEGLARDLGITPELLREAMALSRMAHANEGAGVVNMPVWSPIPIRGHVLAAGVKNGFALGDYSTFFRSLFHAAMQTSYEPMIRGHGSQRYGVALDAHVKGKRVKPVVLRGKKRKIKCNHQRLRVNEGLHRALKARARAYRRSTATYCLQWILDAIDGLLPKDLHLDAVRYKDLYPRPENYVLPVQKPLALPPERIEKA